MRSSLTKPIPLKEQRRNLLEKLFNVILVKQEWPALGKSVAWLISAAVYDYIAPGDVRDRFVCRASKPLTASFNDFVGSGDQCWGHRKAERSRGVDVDGKIEFVR
jgi:hypothetical protein